jgi:uncharacterized protein (DUF302 family)
MQDIRYGWVAPIDAPTFERAIEIVTEALAREGFGVLTRIDVRDTLKKKLGVDVRAYTILGACNPTLAHRAIALEPQIGLLLPCNVVVQEADDGRLLVSIASPLAMFDVVSNAALDEIVDDADARIRRVMASLTPGADAKAS